MRGAERVIVAFAALGEAGEPAALAQGADARAPAGEDLVRIGLVADVPDQAVGWRVEHVVQGNRELDDAEAGAQMPARRGDGVDGLGAQLVGELAQLGALERPQVRRRFHAVEERCGGGLKGCCARWGYSRQWDRGGLRQGNAPRVAPSDGTLPG